MDNPLRAFWRILSYGGEAPGGVRLRRAAQGARFVLKTGTRRAPYCRCNSGGKHLRALQRTGDPERLRRIFHALCSGGRVPYSQPHVRGGGRGRIPGNTRVQGSLGSSHHILVGGLLVRTFVHIGMAKYFITGGAGFLGINMVRYLLERGHEVVSYDISPFEYPEKDQVHAVAGDIRDISKLTDNMRGADVVIHTAAALPLYSAKDIRSTDIEGTRNVLEAAKKNNVGRAIHISSTAVYGIPDHHPLHESDALDGVGEYGKAKLAAEEICLE